MRCTTGSGPRAPSRLFDESGIRAEITTFPNVRSIRSNAIVLNETAPLQWVITFWKVCMSLAGDSNLVNAV
jgi:hypothetical protein